MNIEELIKQKDAALENARRLADIIDVLRHQCQPHEWGKVEYVPEHTDGYCIPKEPEGYCGVDRRYSDIYVDATTTPKWKRTCKNCKLVQTTKKTKLEFVCGNIPGTGGQFEIPDFH